MTGISREKKVLTFLLLVETEELLDEFSSQSLRNLDISYPRLSMIRQVDWRWSVMGKRVDEGEGRLALLDAHFGGGRLRSLFLLLCSIFFWGCSVG